MLAGAFGEGVALVQALGDAATRPLSPVACKSAIESLGASAAYGEAVAAIGDVSSEEFGEFEKLARAIGPAAVDRLLGAFQHEIGHVFEWVCLFFAGGLPQPIYLWLQYVVLSAEHCVEACVEQGLFDWVGEATSV